MLNHEIHETQEISKITFKRILFLKIRFRVFSAFRGKNIYLQEKI